jgi:hypothetical protein
MKLLIDTLEKIGSLHHAYILEGDVAELRQQLFAFILDYMKVPLVGNPDFWHSTYETFTIDDARQLREAQSNKAVGGDRKIFVIETRAITVEAQNSLLKVLEEPTAGTYIFIILLSVEVLLPTLRSRAIIISQRGFSVRSHEAQAFLQSSLPERMKIIAEIAEEKNKIMAFTLVAGLISELHGKPGKAFVLAELLKTRMYLNDRSPSIKLLLEHIACIL